MSLFKKYLENVIYQEQYDFGPEVEFILDNKKVRVPKQILDESAGGYKKFIEKIKNNIIVEDSFKDATKRYRVSYNNSIPLIDVIKALYDKTKQTTFSGFYGVRDALLPKTAEEFYEAFGKESPLRKIDWKIFKEKDLQFKLKNGSAYLSMEQNEFNSKSSKEKINVPFDINFLYEISYLDKEEEDRIKRFQEIIDKDREETEEFEDEEEEYLKRKRELYSQK